MWREIKSMLAEKIKGLEASRAELRELRTESAPGGFLEAKLNLGIALTELRIEIWRAVIEQRK